MKCVCVCVCVCVGGEWEDDFGHILACQATQASPHNTSFPAFIVSVEKHAFVNCTIEFEAGHIFILALGCNIWEGEESGSEAARRGKYFIP